MHTNNRPLLVIHRRLTAEKGREQSGIMRKKLHLTPLHGETKLQTQGATQSARHKTHRGSFYLSDCHIRSSDFSMGLGQVWVVHMDSGCQVLSGKLAL